ncbi:hypothetical protein BC830DRAFT_1167264 [Chytriomyces sp. MP71]|nr:hypothetical protein BC830DRAFT_1167264 [Chytriomyces sp. MP71]
MTSSVKRFAKAKLASILFALASTTTDTGDKDQPRFLPLNEVSISRIVDSKLPDPSFDPRGKLELNLSSTLNTSLLANPHSLAITFRVVQEVAWNGDDTFHHAAAEGATLSLTLHPTRFIQTIVSQILSEDPDFGFPSSATSNHDRQKSVIIRFDLPFGKRFEASQLRGALLAQTMALSLAARGWTVTTQARVQFWQEDTGRIIVASKRAKTKYIESNNFLRKLHAFSTDLSISKDEIVKELKALRCRDSATRCLLSDVVQQWKECMRFELDRLGLKQLSLNETKLGWENPQLDSICATLLPHCEMVNERTSGRLHLGKDAGAQTLFHDLTTGTPTQLLADLAEMIHNTHTHARVVNVFPASEKHTRTDCLRALCGLLSLPSPFEQDGEGGACEQVMFGNVSGLDDDTRVVDGYVAPSRWIDRALSTLRLTSGKAFANSNFSDESDEENTEDNEDYDDDQTTTIASTAIALQLLSSKRSKVSKFTWLRIQDSVRDAGLYLQYCYVRICGIQRKSGAAGRKLLQMEREGSVQLNVLKRLETSSHAMHIACSLANLTTGIATGDASVLIAYLIGVGRSAASGHNALFVKDRVDVEASVAKLLVWKATGMVLRRGLFLLTGEEPVDRM